MCCLIGCISAREADANVAGMQGYAMRGLWMDSGYGQKHRNIETHNRKTSKPKYVQGVPKKTHFQNAVGAPGATGASAQKHSWISPRSAFSAEAPVAPGAPTAF